MNSVTLSHGIVRCSPVASSVMMCSREQQVNAPIPGARGKEVVGLIMNGAPSPLCTTMAGMRTCRASRSAKFSTRLGRVGRCDRHQCAGMQNERTIWRDSPPTALKPRAIIADLIGQLTVSLLYT